MNVATEPQRGCLFILSEIRTLKNMLVVQDGTIHWWWNTERGLGFMEKDVLFDT